MSDATPVMVDSQTLALHGLQRRFAQALGPKVLAGLEARGHQGITATHLAFLGTLECGPTSAAVVARDMGISRQAVHRQASELVTMGLLDQRPDPERRNANIITFTPAGERLMADARQVLLELDRQFEARIGKVALKTLVAEFGAVVAELEAGD